MTNKRIYDLTEDTTPAADDYIATDKSGEAAASKVNVNKLILAAGTITGSTSQAQSFGATGIKADVIAESTGAAGVTVDGVLLKDGGAILADAAVLEVDTINEATATAGVTVDSVLVRDGAITFTELGGAAATPAAGKWTVYTKSDGVYVVDDAGTETGPFGAGGAGGAPTDATYITQTANGSLSAEQALSTLATGIVKVTTTTGVLSTAEAGTDYAAASHNHAASEITSSTLLHERGGLETDVSAYSGLVAIAGGATAEVNSKSELEAQLADVSDIAEADGDTYTGAHDFGGADSLEVPNGAGGTTVNAAGEICIDTTSKTLNYYDGAAEVPLSPEYVMTVAVSDEATDLTTGTAKITFRFPFAATLTQIPRASVNTAPVGSTIIVDINEGGSTIFSTELTIDASEETSTTAATAAVLSDTAIADDAEMTIDIVQIGSSTAGKGLKITFYFRRNA